ncbi:hypothetical protein ACJ41O_004439 [Fusarium nematophilum]
MATPNASDERPSFTAFLKKTKQKGKDGDESPCAQPLPQPQPQTQAKRRGKVSRREDTSESPQASSSTPPQKPRKSLTASEKAKIRRAQVRKAQIQHRQRKAEYVKELELEITHFREMISLTEFESSELLKDNEAMKALLSGRGIAIPRCGSQCAIRPGMAKERLVDDSWIDESLGLGAQADDDPGALQQEEEDLFADINVEDIIVTLKKDDAMDTPVFSIRSNSSSSNSTSPPATEGVMKLSPDEEQMVINFILSLEHICWDHFFLGDYPSHAHLADDEAKGHTLMASSFCMAHAPEQVFLGRKLISSASSCHNRRKLGLDPYVPPVFFEWPSPRISLSSLHGLASSLNPGDKELTPIQAWFELSNRFDRGFLLDRDRLAALGGELRGVAKCLEFGAVMEREAFESVIGRVLGESLDDTMAGTSIDEPDDRRTGDQQKQDPASPFGLVGYA